LNAYIKSHQSELQGAQPQLFGAELSSPTGSENVGEVGPWTVSASCQTTGASVAFSGPGEVLGSNTLATTNGTEGRSFETFGPPGSFGVGSSAQGSQTLVLLGADGDYTATYFENADSSNPANCVVVGYAWKLA
jgi:hypothetical protein